MKKQLTDKERIKRLNETLKSFDSEVNIEIINNYKNQLEYLKNG